MKRYLLLALLGLFLAACAGQSYDSQEAQESLPPHGYISVGHIEFMNNNLYGRTPFSYREKEAAIWIVEELLAMGYTQNDIQVQKFSHDDGMQFIYRFFAAFPFLGPSDMPRPNIYRNYSQNVILTIPGQSEEIIVVGAHYDTWHDPQLPNLPGASDNASGTALLLESAQRMLDMDNYYTIMYVFFGAEEIGIIGAYYFVDNLTQQQLDNIVLMINADVILEGPYLIYGAGHIPGGRGNRVMANEITRHVDNIALEIYADHDVEIFANPNMIFSGSDHLPFKEAGLTVVFLASFAEGRNFPIHHTYRDCFYYINENWPGKIDRNMRYASIFLEELLMARYN